jgi:hypothetical protein
MFGGFIMGLGFKVKGSLNPKILLYPKEWSVSLWESHLVVHCKSYIECLELKM